MSQANQELPHTMYAQKKRKAKPHEMAVLVCGGYGSADSAKTHHATVLHNSHPRSCDGIKTARKSPDGITLLADCLHTANVHFSSVVWGFRGGHIGSQSPQGNKYATMESFFSSIASIHRCCSCLIGFHRSVLHN